MGALAFLAGLGGLAAVAWPVHGKYAAVGLGLFALAVGVRAARRPALSARMRLFAAGGATLGGVAFLLGGLKVALTLLAIEHLAGLGG